MSTEKRRPLECSTVKVHFWKIVICWTGHRTNESVMNEISAGRVASWIIDCVGCTMGGTWSVGLNITTTKKVVNFLGEEKCTPRERKSWVRV